MSYLTKTTKPKVNRLERDIQRDIVAALRLHGWFVIRINQGGVPLHNGSGGFRPGPTRGVSDLYALRGGVSAWVEVKQPGRKPTPSQVAFMEQVRQHGGIAIVAVSAENCLAQLGMIEREVA